MRAVVQRVERASVRVAGEVVAAVGQGFLVLLGVEQGDDRADADYLADKIINLRIFEDADGKMNRCLLDTGGQMLVVSQFTLLGDCRRGRRPSFTRAEEPVRARELYEAFLRKSREGGIPVEGGVFQAMMKVDLVNDGPVTVLLDSKRLF